jgi:hypothetical protein
LPCDGGCCLPGHVGDGSDESSTPVACTSYMYIEYIRRLYGPSTRAGGRHDEGIWMCHRPGPCLSLCLCRQSGGLKLKQLETGLE